MNTFIQKTAIKKLFVLSIMIAGYSSVYAQSWQNVGVADFSPSEADFTSMAIDSNGTPYIAFMDYSNDEQATVMKYDAITGQLLVTPVFRVVMHTIHPLS